MRVQKSGLVTYWMNYCHENENGREVSLRCRIYADNGQKETRWEPGYPPEVFVEEIYVMRNNKVSVYLPSKHRFYDAQEEICAQFYEEMEDDYYGEGDYAYHSLR